MSVGLGGPVGTAGVAGLLSYGAPPAQQHYQLWSLDGHPANDAFHALGCGRDAATKQKTPASGVSVNRTPQCKMLWSIVRQQIKTAASSARGAAAVAAVRPSDAVDTTRNTLLSSMEVEDKLKHLTQALRKSAHDLAYARVRNLDLLADQQGSRDAKAFSLDGAAGCNVEQHAAVMEAVCKDPATMRDHFEKVLGAKERVADAAAAMMASYNRNLAAYKRTGDARCFRYDGACFSTAIEIFSKMSESSYEHLRSLFKGLLPSTRRVQDVVNRHTHQPGGILPGSIRDYAAFVSGLPRGEKWAACHGNLAWDGMTVKAGIKWQSSTGTFIGLAQAGTDYDGPTPPQRLLARASELALLAERAP